MALGSGVAPQHGPLGQPLEPGHLDVVALQHLDHRGPHDAGRRTARRRAPASGPAAPGPSGRPMAARPAGSRATAGKTCQTLVANSTTSSSPTTNSGIAASTRLARRARGVERLVPPGRGVRADGDRERDRDRRAPTPSGTASSRSVAEEVQHRDAVGERHARVAGEQSAQPVPVLGDQRLVEAELLLLGEHRRPGVASRPRIALRRVAERLGQQRRRRPTR